MRYPLATETWDDSEKEAAKAVIDSGLCTMGEITLEFEKCFAEKFNVPYAVFSNSGSSANLLAVAALCFKKGGWAAGDEIIVPAVSWSTTYFPLQQYGLKLVFVDVDDNINISVEEVKKALTPKTKGIVAVNLLGMPCDLNQLKGICNVHDLWLWEDNCESMGATYNLTQCGTIGDVGTFSTFFSHHICTVEGGVTVTRDEELYQLILSLRSHGWIRNLPEKNHVCNKTGNPFEDSFKFVVPGYNLRNNDIFAAIGLQQLNKLDGLIEHRRENHRYLADRLEAEPLDGIQLAQNEMPGMVSSWFGFAFHCTGRPRDEVARALQENGIESRPIVAGNFCNNPAIRHMDYRIAGDLPNSENADKNGFFIGNNSEDLTGEIDHFMSVMKSASGSR